MPLLAVVNVRTSLMSPTPDTVTGPPAALFEVQPVMPEPPKPTTCAMRGDRGTTHRRNKQRANCNSLGLHVNLPYELNRIHVPE